MIHRPQSSWAWLFIVRGPKSHCFSQKAKALSAQKAGPTGCKATLSVLAACLRKLHDVRRRKEKRGMMKENTLATVLLTPL